MTPMNIHSLALGQNLYQVTRWWHDLTNTLEGHHIQRTNIICLIVEGVSVMSWKSRDPLPMSWRSWRTTHILRISGDDHHVHLHEYLSAVLHLSNKRIGVKSFAFPNIKYFFFPEEKHYTITHIWIVDSTLVSQFYIFFLLKYILSQFWESIMNDFFINYLNLKPEHSV